MKLHLPKNLHVALMSAIALLAPMAITVGSAAWGNSGLHNNQNFLLERNYREMFCDDGIHPNERGHRLIADTICHAATGYI